MKSVLIVDDTRDIRLLIGMNLRSLGYHVAHAESGREALEMLARGPHPDLVVLDVQMADVAGWDVLSAIRADPQTASLPVVMCTVKSRAEDEAHGWRLGCDGYVFKPFDIDTLEREVAAVLAMSEDARSNLRRQRLAEVEQRIA